MKIGTRVIVTFTDLDPSPGKVIGGSENGLIKILHYNGQENWHPEARVSPLLWYVSS